jgi:hypothetical protein
MDMNERMKTHLSKFNRGCKFVAITVAFDSQFMETEPKNILVTFKKVLFIIHA